MWLGRRLARPSPFDVVLPQHAEVHEAGGLADRPVLLQRVGDHRRGPVPEEVHPLVGQRLQPGVERSLLAHFGSSSCSAPAPASGARSSASRSSSEISRSLISPWCPEVLMASSYMVTSFGQATTK